MIKIFFSIVIVLAIIKLIIDVIGNNPGPSIAIGLIIGVIIFSLYRANISKKHEVEKAQEDKEKRFIALKSALIASTHYKLIENFAIKYGTSYPEGKIKLQTLLKDRGFDFAIDEMDYLISDALRKAEYNTFKERLLTFNPIQFDDYIESFVKLNLPENTQAIDFLLMLLDEKEFKFGRFFIEDNIQQVKSKFELKHFERRLLDNNNRQVSMSDIDTMAGQEFESFLNTLFQKMGYTVKQTKLTGDQGADLVLARFGEVVVVQAKRSNNTIGNKAIQEVVASMKFYNAEKGMVVTNNYFTKAAEDLANANTISLIDRKQLSELISKY